MIFKPFGALADITGRLILMNKNENVPEIAQNLFWQVLVLFPTNYASVRMPVTIASQRAATMLKLSELSFWLSPTDG